MVSRDEQKSFRFSKNSTLTYADSKQRVRTAYCDSPLAHVTYDKGSTYKIEQILYAPSSHC